MIWWKEGWAVEVRASASGVGRRRKISSRISSGRCGTSRAMVNTLSTAAMVGEEHRRLGFFAELEAAGELWVYGSGDLWRRKQQKVIVIPEKDTRITKLGMNRRITSEGGTHVHR